MYSSCGTKRAGLRSCNRPGLIQGTGGYLRLPLACWALWALGNACSWRATHGAWRHV